VNTSGIVAPAGYERIDIGETLVVARAAAVHGVRLVLGSAPTLHEWAAAAPEATGFQGRDTAWGVRLPGGIDVVVRHARRGGVLRTIRGDRYVWPGRAPWELETSLRLQEAGVRTPDVVAYALYPAGPGLCRCDVATKRLPPGSEFPAAWEGSDAPTRDTMFVAVGELLRDLAAAGAQHADLNAKNLYLARDGGRWHAWVLDVDRVRFRTPRDPAVAAQNLARLVRSLRKLRGLKTMGLGDEDLARLTDLAGTKA
jgi:3-deoxy-D-manno-octulosonic acid kinase